MTTINLERNRANRPICVTLESFFDFSFWLAEELQDFVTQTQWQEKQLANAGQLDRLRLQRELHQPRRTDQKNAAPKLRLPK